VDSYAKHPKRLNELGWVSRHSTDDGKVDGFRLGGVRCGNDLHEAGLRSGDVVHSVNGKKVSSIPQALLAYGALRRASELRVEITRKGTRRTLVYLIG
jgi:type II secretory pathway component PulC